MPFDLPPLPFPKDALEPHMSARTFDFHHGKHHQAYVTNLNNLLRDTDLSDAKLEEIVRQTAKDPARAGIFNNAAQTWNHSFFWQCLKPAGGGAPQGALAAKIDADFGSLAAFQDQFKQAATTQFGSGWAWLVLDAGTLKIMKTPNAMTPIATGETPLLTCDVWEHAYYLDYQNRRPDFVAAFLEHLVNWDFAAANFAAAQG